MRHVSPRHVRHVSPRQARPVPRAGPLAFPLLRLRRRHCAQGTRGRQGQRRRKARQCEARAGCGRQSSAKLGRQSRQSSAKLGKARPHAGGTSGRASASSSKPASASVVEKSSVEKPAAWRLSSSSLSSRSSPDQESSACQSTPPPSSSPSSPPPPPSRLPASAPRAAPTMPDWRGSARTGLAPFASRRAPLLLSPLIGSVTLCARLRVVNVRMGGWELRTRHGPCLPPPSLALQGPWPCCAMSTQLSFRGKLGTPTQARVCACAVLCRRKSTAPCRLHCKPRPQAQHTPTSQLPSAEGRRGYARHLHWSSLREGGGRTCWATQRGVRETRYGGGRCNACGCVGRAVPPRSRSRHRLPRPPVPHAHACTETAVIYTPSLTSWPRVPLAGRPGTRRMEAGQAHAECAGHQPRGTRHQPDQEASSSSSSSSSSRTGRQARGRRGRPNAQGMRQARGEGRGRRAAATSAGTLAERARSCTERCQSSAASALTCGTPHASPSPLPLPPEARARAAVGAS